MEKSQGVGPFGGAPPEYEEEDFDFNLKSLEKQYERFYSTSSQPQSLMDGGPFYVPLVENTNTTSLLIPDTMRVYIDLKVLMADGSNLAADFKTSHCSFLPHAIFRSIDVILNGSLLVSSENYYAFNSYILNMCSFTSEGRKFNLSLQGFEEGDEMTSSAVAEADLAKTRFAARGARMVESKTIRLAMVPQLDILNLPSLIPPNCSLALCFHKQNAAFPFFTKGTDAENLTFRITKLKVTARHVVPTPELLNKIMKRIQDPITVPVVRSSVRVVQVPSHQLHVSYSQLFKGILPRYVCYSKFT